MKPPAGTAQIRLLLCALLAAAFASPQTHDAPWDLAVPAPEVELRPPHLSIAAQSTCAPCHSEVTAEWAQTAHAVSWADEIYQAEVKEKSRPEACYGCHIPQPLHGGKLGERPDARADARDFGISCEACHLGPAGEMIGPRDAQTKAHATRRADSMVGVGSSALCIGCHRVTVGPVVGIAKDYETSKQAERGRSCVGCHMAKLERRWADPGSEGEVPLREGRSHAIQTPRDPAFLRRAFEPELVTAGGKTTVRVHNRAGHRVPGLIGRSIELTARVLDATGKSLAEKKLVIDTKTYLPVDGAVELSLDAVGNEVQLLGAHHDPRRDDPVSFLDVRLAYPGH